MRKEDNIQDKPYRLESGKIDLNTGLTAEQKEERIESGLINNLEVSTSKTVGQIFASNIFTFFNLLCFLIFLWIISVSQNIEDIKNVLFMGVIVINTSIGIIQQLKSKAKMDELSLMSSPDVKVLREGEEKRIKLNEILLDDIINLKAGDQICSDSIVCEGSVEVNESLLTGESFPVKKDKGDKLLSGSFVVSGRAKTQVEHVGKDNYIQKLAKKAKEYTETKSELIRSIRMIMSFIAFIIIPMAIFSFLNNFNAQLLMLNESYNIFDSKGALFEAIPHTREFINGVPSAAMQNAYKDAVVFSSAALIGMIPVGMFLLTSVALAVGIVRLARRKALVQELYSIEALARVNMLCLDKTGTITDGSMKVNKVLKLRENTLKYSINDIISSMLQELNDDNETAIALKEYFGAEKKLNGKFIVPFSSERKASAVRFDDVGLCVLGAPEYIVKNFSKKLKEDMEYYQKQGFRCLLFGINNTKTAGNVQAIPKNCTPYALIVIEEKIKPQAIATIESFKENDVAIKVISGDNPYTVSNVAKKAGIADADKFINLHNVSDEEIKSTAMEYTVFGRVNPEQKKLLIETFKKKGKTVAMTGDGVNDILAMKEANCSIAMAKGSEATRNVSQIVLLDSDFGSMPYVVKEGRRVINNVQRSASLFLTKTVFSFLLLLSLIFMGLSYPIEPIQLTFTSMFIIGLASFVLALEPNNNKIKGKFILNIMKNVLPPAISIVVAVLITMELYKVGILEVEREEYKTIITYIIFGIFMLMLFNISKPFNRTRIILFAGILILGLSCAFILPNLPNQSFNLFKLSKITNLVSITLIFSMLFVAENVIRIVDYIIKKMKKRKS